MVDHKHAVENPMHRAHSDRVAERSVRFEPGMRTADNTKNQEMLRLKRLEHAQDAHLTQEQRLQHAREFRKQTGSLSAGALRSKLSQEEA